MVSALLLGIFDVADEIIVADYALEIGVPRSELGRLRERVVEP